MDRLNLPFFYQLGAVLKPLCEMKAESSDRFDLLISGLTVMGYTRALFSMYPVLTVCKASGDSFIASMAKAMEEWHQFKGLPDEQLHQAKPVSDQQAVDVITKATEFLRSRPIEWCKSTSSC